MAQYASIIIDIGSGKLDRPFTYRVPDSLKADIRPGSLVRVPFGKGNNEREGYVIGFSGHADYPDEKIKDILSISIRGTEVTGMNSVRLAAWMKNRYGAPMSASIKTVVTARRDYKPIEKRDVVLLLSEEEARNKLEVYIKKHQVARERLLRELIEVPRQPYSLIIEKLHVTAAVLRAMKTQGVIDIETTTSLRNPVKINDNKKIDLVLSSEQQMIVDRVVSRYDEVMSERTRILANNAVFGTRDELPSPSPVLIHGITGSGKTQVYISIIEEIVKRGHQAIMLIPEISLTYQTLLRFYSHFKDRVTVMNSTLSEGEKSDQFERARTGGIDVIIGPRSALFTPFPKLGVIVVDEEHEGSYKNESMPKYHTRDVAEQIAGMHGAVVVYGSATPSVDTYYRTQTGECTLFELNRRLTGGKLPAVEIADMKEELRAGNKTILSRQLRTLLEDRLNRHEQTMLFLNRRGYSGFVSCRSCGHVMKCPHCDVSLSLHMNGRLVCHYCGYETPMVSSCPECGSRYIAGFKAGTEQIEAYLKKSYPMARIMRMDADTTAKKGAYEAILSSFANEEADILVGTQMIVKGHDFPKVTLVGILLADMSLNASDYRAGERTFELLTQAAGRAGRGTLKGNVVIQTYEPDNYAVRFAAKQDFKGFYEEELRFRKALLYPPYFHMLAVLVSSKNEDHALGLCGEIRELIDRSMLSFTPEMISHPEKADENAVIAIGPGRAGLSRLKDTYRFVVYIKSKKYDTLIHCKDLIEEHYGRFCDTKGQDDVYVQFDFDPMNSY